MTAYNVLGMMLSGRMGARETYIVGHQAVGIGQFETSPPTIVDGISPGEIDIGNPQFTAILQMPVVGTLESGSSVDVLVGYPIAKIEKPRTVNIIPFQCIDELARQLSTEVREKVGDEFADTLIDVYLLSQKDRVLQTYGVEFQGKGMDHALYIAAQLRKEDMIADANTKLSDHDFIAAYANRAQVPLKGITGKSHNHTVSAYRHVLQVVLKLRGRTLEDAGKLVGMRDHTTVIYAIGKVRKHLNIPKGDHAEEHGPFVITNKHL